MAELKPYLELMQATRTPHQIIAQRMKQLRKYRGWSAERLATEMKRVGVPWERMVVTKLENGRRAAVSVEEWLALAHVLNVAPLDLLAPLDGDDDAPPQVTPDVPPPASVAPPPPPTGWANRRDAYPASVHPIRCAASIANPFDSSRSHPTHRCIHPANERTDVSGLLAHLCDCGTEWTEPNTDTGETP